MKHIDEIIEQVYNLRDYDIKIAPGRALPEINGEARMSFCGHVICVGQMEEVTTVQRAIEIALDVFANNLRMAAEANRKFDEESKNAMPSHLDTEDHPIAGGSTLADDSGIATFIDYQSPSLTDHPNNPQFGDIFTRTQSATPSSSEGTGVVTQADWDILDRIKLNDDKDQGK